MVATGRGLTPGWVTARRGRGVDFVVVGLGLGAVGVLVGLALRDLAPLRSRVRADRVMVATDVARRVAFGRGARAVGRVIVLCGAALWLATLLALTLGVSDRAGAVAVMVTLAIALLAAVAWMFMYAQRYHPRTSRDRSQLPSADDLTAPLPLALAIEQRALPISIVAQSSSASPADELDGKASREEPDLSGGELPPVDAVGNPTAVISPDTPAPPPSPDAEEDAPALSMPHGEARVGMIDPVINVLLPVGKAS